jgi:hypothetical protein
VFSHKALANTQIVSTETKSTRPKINFFAPILSENAYIGHIKENERIVQIEPRLYASDPDPSNTLNGLLLFIFLDRNKILFFTQVKFVVIIYRYINMMTFLMR